MINKKALFICRRERSGLMTSVAYALKEMGVISTANAFYLGDSAEYKGYLDKFDSVYNDIDIFSPDLSALNESRVVELTRKYTKRFNFWNSLFSERALLQIEQNIYTPPFGYKPEYGKALIIKALHHADLMISKYKPDFIFDISALGLQRTAIYIVANHKQIPLMLLNKSNIGQLYTIYDDIEWNSKLIEYKYQKLINEDDKINACAGGHNVISALASAGSIYIGHAATTGGCDVSKNNNYQSNKKIRINEKLSHVLKLARKKWRLQKRKYLFKDQNLINYVDNRSSIGRIITRPFERRLIEYKNKKIFNSKKFLKLDKNSRKLKKILYTWHVQPELSTSQMAPFHVNQEIFIQNIARVVPFDAVIIVKPHPSTVGNVDPRLFQFVRQLPNVYFMDPNDSTTELLPECYAVVTLTGTVGLEALAMGVPTFYFGSPKWRVCKSAHYCQNFEELGDCLRNIDRYIPDRNDVACYIQAVVEESIDLCSDVNVVRKDPNTVPMHEFQKAVDNITKLIIRKLDYIEHLDQFPLQK